MNTKPVNPLRVRMIEDMSIRGFSPKTQQDYIRSVRYLAAFIGRSPDTATPEEIRQFQFSLRAEGAGPSKMNAIVSGLRFFFKVTLDRPEIDRWTQFVREPRKLPVVLSQDEVGRLIECAPGPGLKYKAALSLAYGTGLRSREIITLKVNDIDSRRMLIRVEQGKGGRDRDVMLPQHLLDLLRSWWLEVRSPFWLFPGNKPACHMTARQLNRAVHSAADMAGIDKKISLHTLRHSFATHLLESDIDIRVIQVLLGHDRLDTTAHYTRVATKTIREVMSPLDQLAAKKRKSSG